MQNMTSAKYGSVEAIWRYPISAATGEKLDRLRFTPTGADGDRTFGFFDDQTGDTVFPSRQQRWNAAPLASARLDEDGNPWITASGSPWHRFDDPALAPVLESIFGTPVSVQKFGAIFHGRPAAPRYERSPVHLLSRQSIQALQRLLPNSIIDERRFRPNILIDFDAPDLPELPELALLGKEFQIGSLRLRGTLDCGRCSFTSLEQQGLPEDRDVLRTLISRFEKNFGIYCEVLNEADIAIGDGLHASGPIGIDKPGIVIIGAGQAGGTAARALRDLGHRGRITLLGQERHAPYERPPLSKAFLKDVPSKLTPVLSDVEVDALGIEMHLDEPVVEIHPESREVVAISGERHAYEHLIIATGGSARKVPLLSRGHGRVHAIRNASDADALRRALGDARKIFVLGGGWLGLEVAATARALSIEVEVFVRQQGLFSRVLPREVADFIADAHRRHGVELTMGVNPRFREQADQVLVELDGSTRSADLLVVAIGIDPSDHLARRAGLDCKDGIVTDSNGATSDPRIYAIGDVSWQQGAIDGLKGARIESWQNANEQAYRAAKAILGLEQSPAAAPTFWSDQYDLKIQIAGMPDPSATECSRDGEDKPFWNFGSFAVGINRPREIRQFLAGLAEKAELQTTEADVPGPEVPTIRLPVGPVDMLAEDGLTAVNIAEVGEIVLVRDKSRYFALPNKCPHADAMLSEGFIEGGKVVCPLHFAEFDLSSGAVSGGPKGCPRTVSYRVEALQGQLFLHVPEPAAGGPQTATR